MTPSGAYLFTDGRYFLQAEKQLDQYVRYPSSGTVLFNNLVTVINQELDLDETRSSR